MQASQAEPAPEYVWLTPARSSPPRPVIERNDAGWGEHAFVHSVSAKSTGPRWYWPPVFGGPREF